jgi:hypothetical protein
VMTFWDGAAWFSPQVLPTSALKLQLWKMASHMKTAKYMFWYHESKFVGTRQRRFRTEFSKEPPKNVSESKWRKVFNEIGCICKGNSPGTQSVAEARVTSRLHIEDAKSKKHKTWKERGAKFEMRFAACT